MMRKGDKILLIIIAAAIAIGYGWKIYNNSKYWGRENTAIIDINGKVYGKYYLNKTEEKVFDLELPDHEHSIVELKDGRVRIKEAGCPDKVCVRTGWISNPGEMIVCLPYKIVIKISGERNDVDINAF